MARTEFSLVCGEEGSHPEGLLKGPWLGRNRRETEADMQQKKEPVPDDSDLDRKRRETEALLQSIGISPEPPLGTLECFVF